MKSVFFRCDANSTIGMGHVMRCLSIADAFADKGYAPVFLLADNSAEELIRSRGFSTEVLNTDYQQMDDELSRISDLLKVAGGKASIILFVDSYFTTFKYLQALKQLAYVVYIDDVLEYPYPVDVLVNYNIFAEESAYRKLYKDSKVSLPKLLLGTRYVPLRKQFSNLPRRIAAPKVKDVMISTGGADSEHIALQLAQYLLENNILNEVYFHFLVGAMNQDLRRLEEIAAQKNTIILEKNVTDMASLMQSCDLAVAASGSTLYELCACGVPIISYIFADNQRESAIKFAESGVSIYVGDYREILGNFRDEVFSVVTKLRYDLKKRLEMVKFGYDVSDGTGSARLAEQIEEVYSCGVGSHLSLVQEERGHSMGIRFIDVDWGDDEAKNDDMLSSYFVEFPGFQNILSGKKRYIIGRKGTGKTAILKIIRNKADSDPTVFNRDISLRDFPLNDFRSMEDKAYQDKSKYVSAWKFVLLTEILKMVIEDESVCETGVKMQIHHFLRINFPEGFTVTDTIKKISAKGNKVSLGVTGDSANAGFSMSKNSEQEIVSLVHYHQAVKYLQNLLIQIHTENTFYISIDELDEGYNNEKQNLRLIILALLRAADEIYRDFKAAGLKIIPLVALRSDIFDSLEDNDLNKLDDYILRLNWDTSENGPWALKRIVEKRIEHTVKEKKLKISNANYWELVADEKSIPQGIWKNICILTFSRPRDIIKFLKICSEYGKSCQVGKLSISDVRESENEYSAWFYRELRDEIQSFMSCWREALNCLTELTIGKGRIQDLENSLQKNPVVQKWCEQNNKQAIDVIKILFDYSVIGCINAQGRWIFHYKDSDLEFMPSYPYYCVHFGFCNKLRINRSYEGTYLVEAMLSYK